MCQSSSATPWRGPASFLRWYAIQNKRSFDNDDAISAAVVVSGLLKTCAVRRLGEAGIVVACATLALVVWSTGVVDRPCSQVVDGDNDGHPGLSQGVLRTTA